MSLTAQSPQPSLAWQFESSNVDYVTNLAPSSSVQPGPAQLQGSAALVTNAPTSNTAVYFPGTSGSYMGLGSSTSTNIDQTTSNIFVEAWVYFNDLSLNNRIFTRNALISSPTGNSDIVFRTAGTAAPDILYFNYGSGGSTGGANVSGLVQGTWCHVAMSSVKNNGVSYVFLNGVPGTGKAPPAGTYTATANTFIGAGASNEFANMYVRDLRVIKDGVIPTAAFTPEAAPFSYSLPSYVTGGTTVFTLLGQFITYVPGKYGQSIKFVNPSGTTVNYITYSIPSYSPTSFTWAYWVSCAQVPALNIQFPVYFTDSLASSTQMRVGLNPGAPSGSGSKFYMYNGSGYLLSPTITQDTWYHICVMLTSGAGGSTATFYQNGSLVGSFVLTNNQAATITNMYVGSANTQYGALCSVDDLRIYNTALSAAQVQSIYAAQGMPSRGVYSNIIGTNKIYTLGTPLFAKLSSSAVGAFSLRAINGTTAKAVQVKRQSDSATQDFYADRLGNLLTAPVTGQTLSNWLGGSTGNVVTWYDQSLTSNNMTQATAANQPIISSNYVLFGDPAPTGFNFLNANIDLGNINGSYSKSVWVYPNNIASGRLIASPNTLFQVRGYHDFGLVTNLGIYFAHGASTYTWYTNYTVPINTWSHLVATYDNPNNTVQLYVNSVNVRSNLAYTVQFNAGDGLVATTRIGHGNGGNTFGYIEYPIIFNTVLSQTDINTLYANGP